MAINTSGFQAQDLAQFTPGNPALVAGGNSGPAVSGMLSAIQLANQANTLKYLSAIQPSQTASTIASNDASTSGSNLKTGENTALQGINPISAKLIEQGQPPISQETTGTYNPDGSFTQSDNKNIAGIKIGSNTQTSVPVSTVTRIEPSSSGENIQNTYSYVLKPGSPSGSSAVAWNPKTGRNEPTQFAQQVGSVKSEAVSHYAPVQRNNAGAEADLITRINAAQKSGDTELATTLQASLKAAQDGDAASAARLKAQADKIETDKTFSGVKTPEDFNRVALDNANHILAQLQSANAGPDAIKAAQDNVVQIQTRIKQLADQDAAKTEGTKATTGLTTAKTSESGARSSLDAAKGQEAIAKGQAATAMAGNAQAAAANKLAATQFQTYGHMAESLTILAEQQTDPAKKQEIMDKAADYATKANNAAQQMSKSTKGATPAGGTPAADSSSAAQKFGSVDEVKAAFTAGKIPYDQAAQILSTQFGIKQ